MPAPTYDITAIASLIGAIAAVLTAVVASVAAIIAWRVRGDVHSVHLQLNSRFDEWREEAAKTLKDVAEAEHAKGKLAGAAEAKAEKSEEK